MRSDLTVIELVESKKIFNIKDDEVFENHFDTPKTFIEEEKISAIFNYIISDNKVTCIVVDDFGIEYARGISRCHPEDYFDINIGMSLAEIRARKNMQDYLENRLLEKIEL